MARRQTSSRKRAPTRRSSRSTASKNSRSRASTKRKGGTSRRGFAAMSLSERRAIASMGGRASHGGRGRDYVRQSPVRQHAKGWKSGNGYVERARLSRRRGGRGQSYDERNYDQTDYGRNSRSSRDEDYDDLNERNWH